MIWKRLFGGGKSEGERVDEVRGDQVAQYTKLPNKEPAPAAQNSGSWQPVNSLEEQMADIPNSVDAQFAFARLLLETDVLLATPKSSKNPGRRVLREDEQIDILSFDDTHGGSAGGIFTSEARLVEALGQEASYIQINGRTALKMLAQTGTIINPGSGLWVRYSQPVIERILNGDI